MQTKEEHIIRKLIRSNMQTFEDHVKLRFGIWNIVQPIEEDSSLREITDNLLKEIYFMMDPDAIPEGEE